MAAMIAILFGGVLMFGLLALTFDIARVYFERRELQNAADASVMSLANTCGNTTNCTIPNLATVANNNMSDRTSTVAEYCGPDIGIVCTNPGKVRECRKLPESKPGVVYKHYFAVTTKTRTGASSTVLPFTFAPFLSSSLVGATGWACAQAAAGPPASMNLPFAFAVNTQCWALQVSQVGYAPLPPYSDTLTVARSYELRLPLYTSATGCARGNPLVSDTSTVHGGFGWLSPTTSDPCAAIITPRVDGTYALPPDPGVSLDQNCKTIVNNYLNRLVTVAVYDGKDASGNLKLVGFAPFYITGYDIPSTSHAPYAVTRCVSGDKCLYGWFLKSTLQQPADINDDLNDYGLRVVRMVG